MPATDSEPPTILVVDDEERVGQAFELWLTDYEVVTTTDGETALERMDDDVDLVLLDRHMPGLSGDEVLERIREAGYDCRVAMVTAVDPDFDIVDMPFDHYVSKPVDDEELREVVARLLDVDNYDRRLQELYTVTQKMATLEAGQPGTPADDRYTRLRERRESLRAEVDDLVASMDDDDVNRLFESVLSLE